MTLVKDTSYSLLNHGTTYPHSQLVGERAKKQKDRQEKYCFLSVPRVGWEIKKVIKEILVCPERRLTTVRTGGHWSRLLCMVGIFLSSRSFQEGWKPVSKGKDKWFLPVLWIVGSWNIWEMPRYYLLTWVSFLPILTLVWNWSVGSFSSWCLADQEMHVHPHLPVSQLNPSHSENST